MPAVAILRGLVGSVKDKNINYVTHFQGIFQLEKFQLRIIFVYIFQYFHQCSQVYLGKSRHILMNSDSEERALFMKLRN